jgi:hypothetical protein
MMDATPHVCHRYCNDVSTIMWRGLLLWCYWRAYSLRPPPPVLQRLLAQLFAGQGLNLYVR